LYFLQIYFLNIFCRKSAKNGIISRFLGRLIGNSHVGIFYRLNQDIKINILYFCDLNSWRFFIFVIFNISRFSKFHDFHNFTMFKISRFLSDSFTFENVNKINWRHKLVYKIVSKQCGKSGDYYCFIVNINYIFG